MKPLLALGIILAVLIVLFIRTAENMFKCPKCGSQMYLRWWETSGDTWACPECGYKGK